MITASEVSKKPGAVHGAFFLGCSRVLMLHCHSPKTVRLLVHLGHSCNRGSGQMRVVYSLVTYARPHRIQYCRYEPDVMFAN